MISIFRNKALFIVVLILYLSSFIAIEVNAQKNIKFKNISLEEGLSQSVVYSIFQDKDGFLWFATQDGLNKYDGYKFTVYQNNSDEKISNLQKRKSISNNAIRDICQDRKGNLWIGTEGGGLNCFDIVKETFTTYINNSNDKNSLSYNIISDLFIDNNDVLWIGTDGGGVNILDINSKKNHRLQFIESDSNSLSSNEITCICKDYFNNIWIGTYDKGLVKYSYLSKKITRYYKNQLKGLTSNSILSLYADRNSNLWIGTEGSGICKMNIAKNEIVSTSFTNVETFRNLSIQSIFEDSKGLFWIGTFGNGLIQFNPKNNLINLFLNDINNNSSISNNFILSIFQDRTGSIWVGTYGGGLNKYDPASQKFEVYSFNPKLFNENTEVSKSISSNAVRGIYEDSDGAIWIGTRDGGLNKFNASDATFKIYKNNPNNKNSISHNSIYAIIEDGRKDLWLGTNKGGLIKFERKTNKFTTYLNNPADDKSLPHNIIRSLVIDQQQNLWISTMGGGFCKYIPSSNNFKNYKIDQLLSLRNDNRNWSENAIYTMLADDENHLWLGSEIGLLCFDTYTEKLTSYSNKLDSNIELPNNAVFCLSKDESGNIWVGTDGGGLIRVKKNQKNVDFEIFSTKDGLPNNCIYSIVPDNSGNIWITTNKGICKFTYLEQNNQVITQNYDTFDGLPSKEFNLGAFAKTKNGKIYFGSIKGLVGFFPDSVLNNKIIPKIILSDFLLFNKKVLVDTLISANKKNKSIKEVNGQYFMQRNISNINELILNYDENVITFEFAALHFSIPEKNQYAYILEGFDKDWNFVGTRRFASYTNLEPGSYVFKVKASNCDGVWNNEGFSLKIEVLPPFWQTWWFKSIILLIIILLIVTIINYREQKLKQDKEKLERTVKIRTEELREANEELNMQNEEISSQRDEIETQNQNLLKANQIIESKNKNITDSIKYAQRIQSAMLPPINEFKKLLPESFIYYLPKSIVSGDFYWVDSKGDYIYIAVVDCTGHGVPGAFMSIVGNNLLNQALNEKNIEKPNEILNYLSLNISKTLHQSNIQTSINDGMDLVLIRFNQISLQLEFAGVQNSLFILRKNEMNKLQGDHWSIGKSFNEKFNSYNLLEFQLMNEDMLYLTTDGYFDQFHYQDLKKFSSSRFKELILQISNLELSKQENIIKNKFEQWKGNSEQIDDVTVLGIRIIKNNLNYAQS